MFWGKFGPEGCPETVLGQFRPSSESDRNPLAKFGPRFQCSKEAVYWYSGPRGRRFKSCHPDFQSTLLIGLTRPDLFGARFRNTFWGKLSRGCERENLEVYPPNTRLQFKV